MVLGVGGWGGCGSDISDVATLPDPHNYMADEGQDQISSTPPPIGSVLLCCPGGFCVYLIKSIGWLQCSVFCIFAVCFLLYV